MLYYIHSCFAAYNRPRRSLLESPCAGARALGAKVSNVGHIFSNLPPDLAYVGPRLAPFSPMLDGCLAYVEPSLDLG